MLHVGDARAILPTLAAQSVAAVVTDPPYELGFMGRGWDRSGIANDVDLWRAVLRVMKPGAHLLAFGGTRTAHRMVCAIEDAGFEIRDTLCWLYGQGFPKSLDVGKALDKAAGAEREVVGTAHRVTGNACYEKRPSRPNGLYYSSDYSITAPATDLARQWDGWGTALKPGWENICHAQKPHDITSYSGILIQKIWSLLCQLPSYARGAGRDSPSSLNGHVGDADSALWRAVEQCSTPDALYDLMATWPSESAIPSILSIACSWLNILAVLLTHERTFTTETVSALTTDLRILNSLLSNPTPAIIIEAATPTSGTASSASPVAAIFSGLSAKLPAILSPSALGSVTDNGQGPLPVEAAPLQPELRQIVLARAPLSESTIAANVARWGTGALNVDGGRIGTEQRETWPCGSANYKVSNPVDWRTQHRMVAGRWPPNVALGHTLWCNGVCHESCPVRLLDAQSGSKPASYRKARTTDPQGVTWGLARTDQQPFGHHDTGGASRFFYVSKASAAERNRGLDGIESVIIHLILPSGEQEWENADHVVQLQVDTGPLPPKATAVSMIQLSDAGLWSTWLFGSGLTALCPQAIKYTTGTKTSSITGSKTLDWLILSLTNDSTADVSCARMDGGNPAVDAGKSSPCLSFTSGLTASLPGVGVVPSGTRWRISASAARNFHPTVKPLALMRWLLTLVVPPGGVVLDPFAGSGSTLVAAAELGIEAIGIEQDAAYCATAAARLGA